MQKTAVVRSSFGVLVFLMIMPLWAAETETQNQKAAYWFEQGVKAKDMQTKIDAYTKAIEFDPQFVEALYNLGIAYKNAQNYAFAEQYFAKALNVKKDRINPGAKLQILFELAMAYKESGKLRESEKTFIEAKELAVSRKLKSRISLNLSRVLMAQKRFQEALSELEAGKTFDGAKRDDFSQLIRSIQLALQAEEDMKEAKRLYAEAQRRLAEGDLAGAKKLFGKIRAITPGFRDVSIKIAEIDVQLHASLEKTTLQMVYDQAVQYESEGNTEMAVATYQNLLAKSANFKDAPGRLSSLLKKNRSTRVKDLAEDEYVLGMSALRGKNWVRAISSFKKALRYDSNYHDVRKRLQEAQRGLDRENLESVLVQYYAEGLLAMKQIDFAGAFMAFDKVSRINPKYRNVAELLKKTEAVLVRQNFAAVRSADKTARIDSLREEAEAAMMKEDWVLAVASLEILRQLAPGDPIIIRQLTQAEARLSDTRRNTGNVKNPESLSRYVAVGGIVSALLLLPVVGVFVFSPTARARVHLLRGNYAAAALIYESALARNPGRVKLYKALANIYLLSDRRDEGAIKVYKTVLRLNLPVQDRERMHSMVAQQYVTGETTDDDAIDVLEKELEKEFERKNRG